MDTRFYNTLTNSIELFTPIDSPRVSMYNCGPTVYDYVHIGNFKTFLFADVLRRFLELAGCDVHQVMNLTDVGHMTEDQFADGGGEDKMAVAAARIKEAKKQSKAHVAAIGDPDDPCQIADFYIDAFLQDARLMNMKVADEFPANTPRASQHVDGMQAMIAKLIEHGHAYVANDGVVYYSVESFDAYGRLSGNTLDRLRTGAGGRVRQEDQAVKRHPGDFFLWKPDPSHIMRWNSPWGEGYPGWHIECSVMATALLGRDQIDIHTGGEDNIFPHHECEIAQTCGATGGEFFARYWLHSRHLLVDGEKMSKSKGTFHTVRDVLDGRVTGRPVHPAILRYELIRGHYRSNLNFTFASLQQSALEVAQLRSAATLFAQQAGDQSAQVDLSHPVLAGFAEAMADDLNISSALGVVFDWLKKPKGTPAVKHAVLEKIDSVLGILRTPAAGEPDVLAAGSLSRDELDARLQLINEARANMDYDAADAQKQALRDLDYDVQDTPACTIATARPIVVDPAHVGA
ncbi:MAG: cysteine--tRNA ligase [Phycisphaeraceae bacterium]|nr:cysteine--tRNA ligase [Phycisphaeraceae bacterium]